MISYYFSHSTTSLPKMSTHSTPTNTTTIAQSISTHYNLRAKTYDDATTFHQSLAKEYVKYAKPLNGEKLLDLACGTGLVVFARRSFESTLEDRVVERN